MFFQESFAAFKNFFVKSTFVHASPFCELKNEANKFPQLFLYSKSDVVIPYKDVEKFIGLRRDQGIKVSSVRFEDAEHVKIYIKYPEQYVQSVCNFIRNCMAMADNEATTNVDPCLVSRKHEGRSNFKYD